MVSSPPQQQSSSLPLSAPQSASPSHYSSTLSPPNNPRPAFAGPPTGPEPPFPIRLSGPIIKGFGRGSKELGIPTANIPISGLSVGGHEDVQSGVYFGFAGVDIDDTGRRIGGNRVDADRVRNAASTTKGGNQVDDEGSNLLLSTGSDGYEAEGSKTEKKKGNVYPMVMSIGWNPFYKNTVRSVEVHLLPAQPFEVDFYGARMNLLILGFIRPEYDYVSAESLVMDIMVDIEVTKRSLKRDGWWEWGENEWLLKGLGGRSGIREEVGLGERDEKWWEEREGLGELK